MGRVSQCGKFIGTQSRNRIPALVVKSAMNLNKLLLVFRPDPARLPPLPGTQLLAIQTSQCLLHCTIFLASCLYYACSVISCFFSAILFQVSIWEVG